MSSPRPLSEHIERLLLWCDTSTKPPHETIRVLDTSEERVRYISGNEHGWTCPPEALQSPEGYADRFDELQRAGYSWINLSLYGLVGPTLIVGIELPHERVGIPVGKTSINYSAPSHDPATGKIDWRAPIHLAG